MLKNQTIFDDKETSTPEKLVSEQDFKIDGAMIHTMAKDIQEQDHPSAQKQSIVPPTVREQTYSLDEKQKSSPFLTPELLNSQPPAKKEIITLKEEHAIIKETPNIIKENYTRESNSFKTIFLIIILIAMVTGAGFYYFNVIRQTEVVITKPTSEPIVPTEPKFFTNHPNYLAIDIDNLTSIQIKDLLNNYAEEIKTAGLTEPVEFIITDLQNNPIDFTIFSQKIGITLSKKVLSNLEPAFSLFIFNDAGNVRFGLDILTNTETALKNALLSEEDLLAKNLEAILSLNTNHKFLTSPFKEVNYNGTIIRYQNIISPEELSIDYAISNGQLLIGTTKNTMHAIVDKIVLSPDSEPSN
jgi:hypothetical protein